MSLYISNDRAGHVREVWPLASDNPELDAAAREQVLRWQYKPYSNGGPSQMEAVLTFAFTTRIENPIPVLTNAEARKLATRVVEAVVAPGKARKGTRFTSAGFRGRSWKSAERSEPKQRRSRRFIPPDQRR